MVYILVGRRTIDNGKKHNNFRDLEGRGRSIPSAMQPAASHVLPGYSLSYQAVAYVAEGLELGIISGERTPRLHPRSREVERSDSMVSSSTDASGRFTPSQIAAAYSFAYQSEGSSRSSSAASYSSRATSVDHVDFTDSQLLDPAPAGDIEATVNRARSFSSDRLVGLLVCFVFLRKPLYSLLPALDP